jgi:hypothetical protein
MWSSISIFIAYHNLTPKVKSDRLRAQFGAQVIYSVIQPFAEVDRSMPDYTRHYIEAEPYSLEDSILINTVTDSLLLESQRRKLF